MRNSAQAAYESAVDETRRAYDAAQARATIVFNETLEQARDEIEAMEQQFVDEAEELIAEMATWLADAAPDPELFDWPEPAEAEEWSDDPLYDSTRTYVEQVDRFREYQGEDADVRLARDRLVTKTCFNPDCGKSFETSDKKKKYCSTNCSNRHTYHLRTARQRRAVGDKPLKKGGPK